MESANADEGTTKQRAAIPPIVRSLGWVSFFTDSASEMIYPLLPALLASLGGASVWLGAMEGIAEGASALVKWRIGPVIDRAARKKPYVLAGYTLATFVRPLIAIATAGWHVVLLRSLDRIGKGIRGVPRDTLVAESVRKEDLATAFAFHRMMDNAGSVLGPILAFVLLRTLELPVPTVIGLAIVPGLIAVAVLVLGVHEPSAGPEARAVTAREPGLASARLPRPLVRYLAIVALFTLGASADSFLLLRAVQLGMSAAWTPLLWLALSAAKAASNVPGGWIADRVGRKRTLATAWVLYAIFYAALPHVTRPLPFALVVVAYGSYYGLSEGSERALVAELAPPAIRGRAFGALHAITGLAVLPANVAFGVLYAEHVGLAFGASAVCAGAAAVLLALFVEEPLREKIR